MIHLGKLLCDVMKKEKMKSGNTVKKTVLIYKKNSNQLRLVFLFDIKAWGDIIITPQIKNRQNIYPGDFETTYSFYVVWLYI